MLLLFSNAYFSLICIICQRYMIEKTLYLQKKKGETPLACVERFRADNPDYEGLPMTYAGRLDPIATGELLVLVGDECKKKDEYLGLDKEYEATVLLGLQTDSYDILGIPELRGQTSNYARHPHAGGDLVSGDTTLDPCLRREDEVTLKLEKMVGKFTQSYPPYSSKTVNGKQLHEYARAGEIDTIELPTKEVEIYQIKDISVETISADELKSEITEAIDLVVGDFRQEEIKDAWREILNKKELSYTLVSFTVRVSSGTYIRSLADRIGGTLLRLKRTKIFEKQKP